MSVSSRGRRSFLTLHSSVKTFPGLCSDFTSVRTEGRMVIYFCKRQQQCNTRDVFFLSTLHHLAWRQIGAYVMQRKKLEQRSCNPVLQCKPEPKVL